MITNRSLKIKQTILKKKDDDKKVNVQINISYNHDIEKNDLDNIIKQYTENIHFNNYKLEQKD